MNCSKLYKRIKKPGQIWSDVGVIIIIIILSITVFSIFSPPHPGHASAATADAGAGTRTDYYDLVFNCTTIHQDSDGLDPVFYVITVTNTGNRKDNYTLYANIIDVTDCDEPDIYNWSYSIDKNMISLEPSHSTPVVLSVSSSCKCQVGCIATIAVKGISNGDPAVSDSILTYTTREERVQKHGLQVKIEYNPLVNVLSLNTRIDLHTDIWNIQNKEDSVLVLVIQAPPDWSVSVSPSNFIMGPNSKQSVTLSFTIPENITSSDYIIELRAQSELSPSIQGKDKIQVPVKPDIIVNSVEFSKSKLHADENIEIIVNVENIGLVPGSNVTIEVFDSMDLAPEHKLGGLVIQSITPSQAHSLSISWRPGQGKYNITIRIDPKANLDELNADNNMRVEPVTVSAAMKSSENDESPLWYLLIIIVVFVFLLIFFKTYSAMKKPGQKELEVEQGFENKKATKINRTPARTPGSPGSREHRRKKV